MHIRDLIDKARAATGANYTEIATRLGRSKQLVSNWRSGAKIPEDDDVMALARMARERVEPWLATAQAARSHGEVRTRWEHIAKQLGAAAVVVLAVALPWPSEAANQANLNNRGFVHYAQCFDAGWPHGLRPWDAASEATMRPPCWPDGSPCPNWCARAYYDRTIHNRQHLPEPWQGWRLAGRWLINPSGERVAPHLLDRWMYRHSVMFR